MRRRGGGQSRHFSRLASPVKVEREKAPCKTQGEPLGSHQKGLWPCPKYEVGVVSDAPYQLWPQGVSGPLPHLSGDSHLCWPNGLWSPQCSGGVDWAKGPPGVSPHSERFPKKPPVFLVGASYQIAQDHGTKGNPFPSSPVPVSGTVILSMVQKGRAEWKHGSQPSVDELLLLGPHLQPVPKVLYDQHQHYASPLTVV